MCPRPKSSPSPSIPRSPRAESSLISSISPACRPSNSPSTAQGALDNFDAKLDFAAGADVWARGDVVVARQGAGRKLTLDLNSRLEGMAPAIIRPVFAGETTLKGDLFFNDDSTIATPGLHLVSANARLDIEGGRSADSALGIKIHAGAIPGATQIGKLDLNASIAGPALSPTIEGSFDAGDIHVEQGSLDHIAATFRAVPNGSLVEESTRIAFEGEGAMSGLALADPALARAIGSEAKLALRGSASVGGDIAFDTLDLSSHDLDARYSGLLAPTKVQGRLEVTARDLSRFAALAGGVLKGEARLTADLDGAPRYGALTATIDAHATHLATAYPMLDRVTGGDLRLTGAARTMPGGGFGFTDLHGERSAWLGATQRRFRARQGEPRRQVDVPQASVLDPRVSGKAEIVATLTGVPDDLNAVLKATLSEGRLLDRKTSGITLEAQATHITGQVEATASASGDIDGHPLQGSAHVAKTADGGWRVDNLALTLGLGAARGLRRDRRGSAGEWRAQLQRDESRRSLAARADQDERRASGEGERFGCGRPAGGRDRREQRPDGVRREQVRRPQGRPEHRRSLGRPERLGPRPARSGRSRRANDFGRQADRDGPRRFQRPRFHRAQCSALR